MNEFFKKLLTKFAAQWAGWSAQQRVIFAVITVVIIGGIVALFRVSAAPVLVPVITAPIRDEVLLDRILMRLDQENIKVTVSANGIVQVADDATAKRMRAVLIREDLIPSGVDPWQIFDRERWTITDMERNVNLQRALQKMITEHIKAIDGIDNANVTIVWPKDVLFMSEQNPVTASVIITPKPASDVTTNRSKIEGIQKILQFAVEGLKPENITINDYTGVQLNDFPNRLASDRQDLIERENKFKSSLEKQYRDKTLAAIQSVFSSDRVRDLSIKIDMDMSQKTVATTEHFPFEMKARTPGLPYDDSVYMPSVLLSESTSETTWRGTGINPEGPTGVEPNVPPVFKDMQNLYGEMTSTVKTHNENINVHNIQEVRSPSIDRVTVSVNIDGKWERNHDAKGKPIVLPNGSIERTYTPVPAEDLNKATSLIREAVGYNSARGDSVTVTNIPIDRTEEFRIQDEAYFREKQFQTTVVVFISGLILLLFAFIMFRMVSREMERRKRLAEEERARREQMLRESAMAEAEHEGMDVSISLEERTRMELMENAINMAKEHPEDAAQLIRTWLLEE